MVALDLVNTSDRQHEIEQVHGNGNVVYPTIICRYLALGKGREESTGSLNNCRSHYKYCSVPEMRRITTTAERAWERAETSSHIIGTEPDFRGFHRFRIFVSSINSNGKQ